jgi:predicted phosphodiesterase
VLPAGVRAASVDGRALPPVKAEPVRIVVVGDTGCRLKSSEDKARPGTFQDCNDPASFPFAQVARAAAAWKPDLVIHVGDYHYRENACPANRPGCAGNSWGYGWDTWRDDFFKPAEPLLAAAPWVVVRGNHETCKRAGQGWWRFLDPRPLLPGRDCNDPANDATADYSEPYGVPLAAGTQLLVADTANTPNLALPPDDPRARAYRNDYARLAQLARRTPYNIALTHHPLLGFYPRKEADGRVTLQPGNAGILSVWGPLSPTVLPANVQVLLSGHTHLWQQVSFSTPHASQFIVGFSGTDPDDVPIPARVPPGAMPAPGAIAERISSWVGGFGFMTMEQHSPGRWQVGVHDHTGKRVNYCLVDGAKTVCDQAVVPRTP